MSVNRKGGGEPSPSIDLPPDTSTPVEPHEEPTASEIVDEALAMFPPVPGGPGPKEIAREAAAMFPIIDGPTHEEIAREAHALFARRGGDHGSDLDDWLEAERSLRAKQKRTIAPREHDDG